MRRSPFKLVAMLTVFAATLSLSHCRATNPQQEAELASTEEEKPWFDMYGDQVSCEVPKGGCTSNTYDVTYVDLCVSKGFQAKTCGCTAACSGKVLTKPKVAAKVPGAKDSDPTVCPEAGRAAAQATTKLNGGTARCVRQFVCNGDPTDCSTEARATAINLRTLMRGTCHDEVLATVCNGSAKDTLTCGDKQIEALAAFYAKAFVNNDAPARRCVRESLCNQTKSGCNDADAKAIPAAKAALDEQGCHYWFSTLCSIDGK